MKILNLEKVKEKDLLVFDLDGTLAPSKSKVDKEMGTLIEKLIKVKKVAVISGGKIEQFKMELLDPLKSHKVNWENLFLFPTCSTAFYKFQKGKWKKVYAHTLKKKEITKIKNAFNIAFKKINYEHPKKVYGEVIEDRGTQVSFSALGQEVVSLLGKRGIRMKEEWARNSDVRPKLIKILKPLIPGLEARIGGLTTIDVTRKGIDKAYGVRKIREILNIPITKMVFIGDKIMPGGNDYAALKTKIDYIPVGGPEETKKIIRKVIG
jgi:phosphomannomutase